MDVRELGRADRRAAVTTLAAAFAADPVMSWLSGASPVTFARTSRWFFADTARRLGALGGAWGTGGCESVALWAPPGGWRAGALDQVRSLPGVLRMVGRRLPVAGRVAVSMERHHPEHPHWYLAFLGTAPGSQGKGLGAQVLAPVLQRCDRDRVPAYLESSNDRNVPFYQRQGFEVTGKLDLPDGRWLTLMQREPVRSAGPG